MHHIIFEGAELAGKSWVMSQVYDYLEPKNNSGSGRLDGCHWFNCDNGVFGSPIGNEVMDKYIDIFSLLKEKNIIVEKFHLTEQIYSNRLRDESSQTIEERLSSLDFKIVLITLPEDEDKIQERLDDRLRLYPHYTRIAHEPSWYIEIQQRYIDLINKSELPYLIINTDTLPDFSIIEKLLEWTKNIC